MLYGWTTKSGCTTPTSQDQPSNVHLQRSGGELLLENTQHDGDAFFEAEKVTLTATFGKISRLLRSQDAGEVGIPPLQTEALLHNGGQDELDAQGSCFSASDSLLS